MQEKYGVYSEFDIQKHKKTFINYLEVMIDRNGKVHYAVPSHQEWAIKEACRQKNITREELCNMTPPEHYLNWLPWILSQCGCVAVWNEFFIGRPNKKQMTKLTALKMQGLYKGRLVQNDM